MSSEGFCKLGRIDQSRIESIGIRGIDHSAYHRDAIGGNARSPGMFLDDCLVRGEIYAVHLIASYIAMEPLDLWTESS